MRKRNANEDHWRFLFTLFPDRTDLVGTQTSRADPLLRLAVPSREIPIIRDETQIEFRPDCVREATREEKKIGILPEGATGDDKIADERADCRC